MTIAKAAASSRKPEGTTRTVDVELVAVSSTVVKAEDRDSGGIVGPEISKDGVSQRGQMVQQATILQFEQFDEMSNARIGLILFR